MQRITGLPDEQVLAYEAQAEAAMRVALEHVMDVIARRIEASMPVLASVLVAADQGDEIPPSEVPAGDGLPPGQPYVSPDDLASIPPLWQEAVTQQILPIVAQVFMDAAGRTHANMVDASSITSLPSVGSLAAEQYLARAQNTFEQVGDDLWATARTELSDGFERGESIPQLAERLRASAGVTARTGVLVARTQVNEASNAGSFATAQASGLAMRKAWFATNDLRTRVAHLEVEAETEAHPIPLNEPFTVGGESAMYPAAPTLSPAMRFNCRCSIGYVMPDRAPAQVRTQDLQDQQLADLPSTSALAEEVAPTAQVLGMRSALAEAKTLRDVDQAAMTEARRLTGRDVRFDQRGSDVQVAREHAEGILRGLERYPESPISQVGTFGPGSSAELITRARGVPDFDEPKAFTATLPGNDVVLFNVRMASAPEAYQAALLRGHGAGWHADGTATPTGQALHEFGHTVDETFTEAGAKVGAVRSQMTVPFTGKAYKEAVRTEVSGYAATSTHELGGEAFADVMINGERASATSRAVFDAIERGYAKVHPRVGETFPKAAGPDFDIPARGPTAPPGYVRPSLKAAKTPRELRRVWQDEAQAATGFPFFVQAMPRGISMVTAREYAEGTLQMLERFPGARVDQIKWFDDAASKSYAQVRRGGHAIEFNMKYASETGRPKFLESRRRDAAGWDVGDTSWGVRNDTTGQGVVYHEFMHILDLENTREKIHGSLVPLLIREADREGVTDIEDLIRRRVSSYAAATTSNMQELIAEAGADVMVNGAQASQLSRSIFDLLQAEYRARGFGLRVAPIDELAVEAERLGEVFPKAAAPKMPKPTVARGKDLTEDKDLAARAQREAEREHADTGFTPQGFPIKPEAYQGDYAFHEIAKAQGFDGLPQIVADDAQWQRLLDADYIPLYRGHGWAGGDGVGQVDAFNYGERYVGGGFAPGNNMSPRYATALHYASGHDSAVGHYALPPDAKVVSYPDLVAERDAYVARLPAGDVERSLYLEDDPNLGLGRFAAARGYDAMVVPRAETLLTERVEEWVIFNRTKIVAYDDSAKGVTAASKVSPAKMTAGERARRAKDVAVTAGRSVGNLTRELDQMIAESGDEAFRSGALWRRIKAKGSQLGTPVDVRDELMQLARSNNKGASLSALRARIEKADLDAGVRRIGSPGEVWRFDSRRDKPWGVADDVTINDGDLVTVLRPGSVIDYEGSPLQIAAPRVRPATPKEIKSAPPAPVAPAATAPPVVAAPKALGSQTVAQLRALAKERGIVVPAATRKADLVKMLEEAPSPTPSRAIAGLTGDDVYRAIPIRDSAAIDDLERVAGLDEALRIQNAVGDYEDQGYQYVNAALRAARGDLGKIPPGLPAGVRGVIPGHYSPERVLKMTEGVDEAMARSVLTEQIEVWRGLDSGRGLFGAEMPQSLAGQTVTDYGYMSTSSRELSTRKFAGNGAGIQMRIKVPAGTRAIGIENAQPGLRAEREILLDRGQTLRITADRTIGGIRTLDAEIVSSTPTGLGEVAVARQAAIDAARPIADLAVRMDEIVANGASRKALLHTVDTLGEQAGLDAAELTRLRALVNDPAALRAATRDLATRAGADLTGATSDVVRFDRALHEPIGTIAPGAPVEIVRPGVSMRVGNEVVPVRKAIVQATDRAPTPTPSAIPAGSPDIRQLLHAPIEEKERVVRSVFEGKFGSYTTKVVRVTKGKAGDEIGIEGLITDSKGREIGRFSRSISVDDGKVYVHHGTLELDETSAQGSGFGRIFNEHVIDWYRRSGIDTVYLEARDVGKYAHAVSGFDFTPASAEHIFNELEQYLDDVAAGKVRDRMGNAIPKALRARPDLSDQIAQARAILARARASSPGSPGYPTAREVSQVGRAPGQKGKSATWLGKSFLLRTPWEGELDLTRAIPERLPSITSRAAQRAEVRARAAAVAAQRGNAALLARVDELVQAKASKAVIRQELDPALRQAEQLYAGADEGVASALRDALDSGEPAKLRAAITRQSKASGLTPIGKAGAKAKFDPATMEGVGGTAIPDGADVIVVRRGTSIAGLETPERATVRLAKPAAPPFKFEAAKAKTFAPVREPRTATVIHEPPDKITEIVTPWGETQRFKGTWVKVQEPGEPGKFYGSAYAEWQDMYEAVPGEADKWIKTAKVQAYQHRGAPRVITTTLADGTVETTNTAKAGDWIVRQTNGEIQVLTPEKFARLYTQPMTPAQFNAKIKAAAKKQEALDAAPFSTTDRAYGPNYVPDAVDRYRLGPDVNDILREQRRGGPRYAEDIHDIDRAFDDSRITRDAELWRSVGSGRSIFGHPSTWGDDLAGFEWSESAYSSTSAAKTVADRFATDGGVRLRVLAPKGSKALQLSVMPEGGTAGYADEAEVLLARGARYRVVRDRGWTEITHPTGHHRIRVRDLDVEVVVPDVTPPLPWETK